jgi:hypothetical protein
MEIKRMNTPSTAEALKMTDYFSGFPHYTKGSLKGSNSVHRWKKNVF